MGWRVRVLIYGGLLTGLPGSAQAGTCALCRQALASGGNPGLIQGFYWSILLIAGVPLLIFAVVAVLVWRARRANQVHVVERNEPSGIGARPVESG